MNRVKTLALCLALSMGAADTARACGGGEDVQVVFKAGPDGGPAEIEIPAQCGKVERWIDDDGLPTLLAIHQNARHKQLKAPELAPFRALFVRSLKKLSDELAKVSQDPKYEKQKAEIDALLAASRNLIQTIGDKPLDPAHLEQMKRELGPTLARTIDRGDFEFEVRHVEKCEKRPSGKRPLREFGPARSFVFDYQGVKLRGCNDRHFLTLE